MAPKDQVRGRDARARRSSGETSGLEKLVHTGTVSTVCRTRKTATKRRRKDEVFSGNRKKNLINLTLEKQKVEEQVRENQAYKEK